jgi:hypothetical protein
MYMTLQYASICIIALFNCWCIIQFKQLISNFKFDSVYYNRCEKLRFRYLLRLGFKNVFECEFRRRFIFFALAVIQFKICSVSGQSKTFCVTFKFSKTISVGQLTHLKLLENVPNLLLLCIIF